MHLNGGTAGKKNSWTTKIELFCGNMQLGKNDGTAGWCPIADFGKIEVEPDTQCQYWKKPINTVRLKFKENRSTRNIIWLCIGDIQNFTYQKTKSYVEEQKWNARV